MVFEGALGDDETRGSKVLYLSLNLFVSIQVETPIFLKYKICQTDAQIGGQYDLMNEKEQLVEPSIYSYFCTMSV